VLSAATITDKPIALIEFSMQRLLDMQAQRFSSPSVRLGARPYGASPPHVTLWTLKQLHRSDRADPLDMQQREQLARAHCARRKHLEMK
jgi:hypothetical protein